MAAASSLGDLVGFGGVDFTRDDIDRQTGVRPRIGFSPSDPLDRHGQDARRLGEPGVFAVALGRRKAGAVFSFASSDFKALGAFFWNSPRSRPFSASYSRRIERRFVCDFKLLQCFINAESQLRNFCPPSWARNAAPTRAGSKEA